LKVLTDLGRLLPGTADGVGKHGDGAVLIAGEPLLHESLHLNAFVRAQDIDFRTQQGNVRRGAAQAPDQFYIVLREKGIDAGGQQGQAHIGEPYPILLPEFRPRFC